jgi:hypothetical protein
MLKPQIYEEQRFIYVENERVDGIFFMITGKAAFVLPRYKNRPYINLSIGSLFGMIDIIGSAHAHNVEVDDWYGIKQKLNRQFSILSFEHSEVLILNIENLNRMQQEFSHNFENLWEK